MWRDISATQVHQSLNPYQQYPPPPSATLQHPHYAHHQHQGGGGHRGGDGSGNGGAQHMTPGSRSSYSLPHPGHAQSNARWQKTPTASTEHLNDTHHYQLKHHHQNPHVSASARNLVQHPSFLYGSGGSQQDLSHGGGGGGGGRSSSGVPAASSQQSMAAAAAAASSAAGLAARQRPASMYETPSMGYAAAQTNGNRKYLGQAPPPAVRPAAVRKNSAELVSLVRRSGWTESHGCHRMQIRMRERLTWNVRSKIFARSFRWNRPVISVRAHTQYPIFAVSRFTSKFSLADSVIITFCPEDRQVLEPSRPGNVVGVVVVDVAHAVRVFAHNHILFRFCVHCNCVLRSDCWD